MIPGPPYDEHGPRVVQEAVLRTFVQMGVFGTCCMCIRGGWYWLDLRDADMDTVTDSDGQPTDQVPLHPQCVPTLLDYWASIASPDPDTDVETAAQSDPGIRAGANPTERALTGAYARRANR